MKFENILKKIFKYREIHRRDGGKYLTRYYVARKAVWWLPSIYIHCFHASDSDQELHNHPWNQSLSLILKGKYSEERRMPDLSIRTKIFKSGMFNSINKDTFHRVDLLTPKVWTLFVSGKKPREDSWGFWNRDNHKYWDWKEFESR